MLLGEPREVNQELMRRFSLAVKHLSLNDRRWLRERITCGCRDACPAA
jgi:hypothetical protein